MIISTKNCVEECIFYSLAYFICCSHFFFVSSQLAKAGANAAKTWASSTNSKSLRPFVATQDLLAFESENIRKDFISKYLGDESDQRTRLVKPTAVNEIGQRERERIPLKTRQSISLSVNVCQAWAKQRNSRIETLRDEYTSVPLNFQATTVEEVNYWLTRFILEVMRADGKPYPANSLYSISTGLLRHFRNDLNRYDKKIISKDDVQF